MQTRLIKDLKGKYGNALIIGSGASLDYLPYAEISNIFSKAGVVICLNETYFIKDIQFNYCINHHSTSLPDSFLKKLQEDIYKHPYRHIISRYDCNDQRRGTTFFTGPYYMYDGLPVCESTQVFVRPLVDKLQNYLFVGGTILLDAIGLAHHLGAHNIFMMGIDGGTVNGNAYCQQYRDIWPEDQFFVTGHSHRTMASLQSFIDWAKPRGWNFVNLSQRMGNAIPIPDAVEVEKHKHGWDYSVIE